MTTATSSDTDLFAIARRYFDEFRAELHTYGVDVDPAMELRRGEGLLCYYDLADGHIYVSLPDPNEPAGKLHLFVMGSLMGCDTDEELVQFFHIFIPHLIAHELAHHVRHRLGLFTKNPWHEEQVANKLAVAICRQRLTPELMAFATRILPPAIRSITEQMESSTIAIDSYRDLFHSLHVAGEISDADLHCLQTIRRELGAATETALTGSGRLSSDVATRIERRADLIAAINDEYTAGPDFVRYVYYHLGWSFIGLVGREGHYVEEFAREYLGARFELLPRADVTGLAPATAIHACYRAYRETAARAPAASRYFYKRYRALLLAAVGAPALLDDGADEDADGLAFLSAIASPDLRELLPGHIANRKADLDLPAGLPTDGDRRLWTHVMHGTDDPGAANTLSRLGEFDRIEVLRSLPAAALLDLAHEATVHRAPPGTLIAREGDGNDDVFFLTKGSLEVAVSGDTGERRVSTVEPGQMFGEDAFLTRRPRRVSVRAVVPSECFVFNGAGLRSLAFRYPSLLMGMAGAVAARLPRLRGQQ